MKRALPWWLIWCIAVLPLLGWYFTGLFDLDEGFYGAVTGEMIRRHEWITPFYNGKPWFEKPILLYWMAKPCVMVFGPWIGARLPSVLSAIGVMAMCARFVRRKSDDRTAQLTVLVLSSSAYFGAMGRLMMTDMPLLLAITGAMLAFWRSIDGEPKQRIWCAFWLGVGVLAKGPVACILFVPIAGLTFWKLTDQRPAFRGYWLAGVTVLAAVVAVWYVPAYVANGHEFVQKFLIEQNIGRFTGGDAAHSAGIKTLPMYAVVLLMGMAPWIFPATKSVFQNVRAPQTDGLGFFLASWALVVFTFFTISSAKLPHYVLPCVPPLAILAARAVIDKTWPLPVAQVLTFVMAIGLNFAQLSWYSASGQFEAHRIALYMKFRYAPSDICLYQLSRQTNSRGTGTSKLAETSLPSMVYYLDAAVCESDSWDAVLKQHSQAIFTRKGRIGEAEIAQARRIGLQVERDSDTGPTEHYDVFTVQSVQLAGGRPPG